MWGSEMACNLLGSLLQGEPHVPAGLAVHRVSLFFSNSWLKCVRVGALHLPGIQPYPA